MEKKMNGKHWVFVAMAAALVGCVTVPQEQMDRAEYGQAPDAETIIRGWLASTLKDPDSIKSFVVTAPVKCANRRASWKPEFGWCVKYEYNAKNSYGGYAGVTSHTAMIQGGKVLMDDGRFVDGLAAQLQ
jgi:hypothetical protein